jgi:hypothetical protein
MGQNVARAFDNTFHFVHDLSKFILFDCKTANDGYLPPWIAAPNDIFARKRQKLPNGCIAAADTAIKSGK